MGAQRRISAVGVGLNAADRTAARGALAGTRRVEVAAAVCALCGAALPKTARFCPQCGAPTGAGAATQERKLVSVLFADLVGSTAIGGRIDAERTRELLGGFYEIVAHEVGAERGQLEKFIGDAAMAVFGLPRVHEDDALRAVRAGLLIADSVAELGRRLHLPRPLAVRVGIETGEAAVGAGPAGQLLVTGVVVNAAARLQAGARRGEILVGDTTRALAGDSAAFGEKRRVRAKGFETALTGHPVLGLARLCVRSTIPLVGRRGELRALRDALELARAAGRPHLVTVLGEAGIGKSRLVDDFTAQLSEEVTVLTGSPDAAGGRSVFGPAAEMLRHLAGIADGDAPERVPDRLAALLDEVRPGATAAEALRGLTLVLGTGAQLGDDAAAVRDAQSAFIDLLVALARRAPTVAIFEDAHLARDPVLELVQRLTWRSRSTPKGLLVIATGRSQLLEAYPTWGTTSASHSVLRLGLLDAAESIELARRAGGDRVDAEAAQRIAERAAGNPFFIIESTGMLNGDGAAARESLLPPTVQAVVTARLDQLDPPLREAARHVSVFLEPFDSIDLALVDAGGEASMTALGDAEVLTRESPGRWRFRHELLREVAYSGLPKRERLALHLAVADGLQRAGRAGVDDHLELAAQASLDLHPEDRSTADRAVDALIQAGERALRRMEPRRTVDRFRRALALAGPENQWRVREARTLAGLGAAFYWLSDYRAAGDALDRAETLGVAFADDVTLARALRFRADIVLNVDGALDEAERLFTRSLDAAQRLDDPREVALSLLFAGWVWWNRDDVAAAEQRWQPALEMARRAGDRWAETRLLAAISVARSELDDVEGAWHFATESLRVARELNDPFSIAVATVQLGRILRMRGRPAEAVVRFDEAAAIYEEIGARWELADALYARGSANEQLDRIDAAEADLYSAVRLSSALGERLVTRWASRALERVRAKRAVEVGADD